MSDRLPQLKADAKAAGWLDYVRSENDERALLAGCKVRVELGEHVCAFFRKFLRHPVGPFAGKPFELADWQKRELIMPLFSWVRPDGTRRFRRASWWMAKKNGKALAIDTPIVTPCGWKSMGDLSVGDEVFDETGLPCRVIAATEVMRGRPCYRVWFSDGESIVADADHHWVTKTRRPESKIMARTTAEIAEDLRIESPGSAGWNHSVPVAGALNCDERYVSIDPYQLGLWLGDGNTESSGITLGHADAGVIIGEIAAGGVKVRKRLTSNENSAIYTIGGNFRDGTPKSKTMQGKLRAMGVLGNKHIPSQYLRGSISQRQALLRGLMDTDGTASAAGQCVFTTTLPALRDGALELLRSLGYKPTLQTKRAMLYGRDCGNVFNIQFYAFAGEESPFSLPRKTARLKARPNKWPRSRTRHITGVDPIESVPVRCVEVDSPSRLYLAGRAMVPTHNSSLCSGLALYQLKADGEAGAVVVLLANVKEQCKEVFDPAANMVRASPQLRSRLEIVESKKRIVLNSTSYIAATSGEDKAADGWNASTWFIDEIHRFDERGRSRRNAFKYAGRARSQWLEIIISTAGDEEGPGRDEYDAAKAILLGTADEFEGDDEPSDNIPNTHVFIAEADPRDDVSDPAVWRKANPSIDIIFAEQAMAEEYAEARKSPSALNVFKRYCLNIWTHSEEQWLDGVKWRTLHQAIDEAALKSFPCCGGLDLSSTTALSAWVLAWRLPDGFVFPDGAVAPPRSIYTRPHFWLPKANIADRETEDRTPYRELSQVGWIELCDGEEISQVQVEERIVADFKAFDLRQAGYDRAFAQLLIQRLQDIHGFKLLGEADKDRGMVGIPQTPMAMASGSIELHDAIAVGRIFHDGNPIMARHVDKVRAYSDGNGNIKPVKTDQAKRRVRIDGVSALVNALCRLAFVKARKRGGLTFARIA